MGTLSAFLHPEIPENKEIILSKRFKDEKGKSVPFVIRPVSEEESSNIRKQCTTYRKDKAGNTVKEFNAARYTRLFVIAGTVTPDFRAADLCEAYGVLDPELVLGKMLLAGEFAGLSDAISELSGITDEGYAQAGEEAKN